MAFNGSGTFLRLHNWVTDRTNGILIRADRADAEDNGFAAGLSNAICKDGQTTIAANIPFNNKKITGLGDATLATDAMNRQASDARYFQRIHNLTALSAIVDGDLFGVRDVSASLDVGVSFADVKTKLTTDFRADGRMFPVGTRMPFQQTTPPTGWTKEIGAAYNDATLRFTTGTVATGGTQGFDVTFASRTFTGTVGNDTPSVAKTAVHDHETCANPPGANTAGVSTTALLRALTPGTVPFFTVSAGGGSVHNHGLTMNAANFDVKYVEMSIGIKA
jgi:hypothetical protein